MLQIAARFLFNTAKAANDRGFAIVLDPGGHIVTEVQVSLLEGAPVKLVMYQDRSTDELWSPFPSTFPRPVRRTFRPGELELDESGETPAVVFVEVTS